MFAWFQRLLPQRGDFFGMFEAHAAMLVAAAEALEQLGSNQASTEKCLRTIQDREHVADFDLELLRLLGFARGTRVRLAIFDAAAVMAGIASTQAMKARSMCGRITSGR